MKCLHSAGNVSIIQPINGRRKDSENCFTASAAGELEHSACVLQRVAVFSPAATLSPAAVWETRCGARTAAAPTQPRPALSTATLADAQPGISLLYK